MADPEIPPRPKKGTGIKAKIVKHAHRRRFQEYVRTKGRDKVTIAYVYWNMYLRSGKGNVFELAESLFLGDLGIGKNALRPARKTLVDDGWLTKDQQMIDPLTGKWGTTAWTVNTEPVAHSEGDRTAAPLTGDCSPDVGSAGDRSAGDTVVLHSLYVEVPSPSTSSVSPAEPPAPPVGTFSEEGVSPLNNKQSNKPSLAPLATDSMEELETLQSITDKQEGMVPEMLHGSVWSLEKVWRDRTGYSFTDDEAVLANKLILTYSYRVNAYLNKRFQDQLRKKSHKRIVVTPLVSMSVSCLERMTWVLQKKAFAEVMEERIRTDRRLRQPFDAAVKYVQRGTAPKLHAHVEAYGELTDRLIVDFGAKEDGVSESPVRP